MKALESFKAWAKKIKREGLTLWFACKDSRTPWYAKALGAFVVAYALSPIDLIPDFIPVLGYVDDLILLPVLIWMTVKLLPVEVLEDARRKVQEWEGLASSKPRSIAGALAIATVWLVVGISLSLWAVSALALPTSHQAQL